MKGRLYKTMVRPAMLYGMEAVSVTKRQERQMELAEMKMLNFSLGVTRKDKVRNEVIREKLTSEDFSAKLREARLRWWGHLIRSKATCVGRQVMELEVGKRKRGRPKRRWIDCVKEDVEMAGVKEEDARKRSTWRIAIHTGDPT